MLHYSSCCSSHYLNKYIIKKCSAIQILGLYGWVTVCLFYRITYRTSEVPNLTFAQHLLRVQ